MDHRSIYRNDKVKSVGKTEGMEKTDESSYKKKKLSGFSLRSWIPDSSVSLFPCHHVSVW